MAAVSSSPAGHESATTTASTWVSVIDRGRPATGPSRARGSPRAWSRAPAGPVPTKPTGRRPSSGRVSRVRREPSCGRTGADDQHRPSEPPATTQHVGAGVDRGVGEHQAGEDEHAERRPRRAGADQDRRRGGRGHEQPGQVLDDREHQPGPVQVRCPGDQHGDPSGNGQGRWRERRSPPRPRATTAAASARVSTGPIVPSHGIRRRTRATTDRPPRTSCADAPPFERAAAAIQPLLVRLVHVVLTGPSPSARDHRPAPARRARLRRARPGLGGVRRPAAPAGPGADRGVGAGGRRRADPRLLRARAPGAAPRGAGGAQARLPGRRGRARGAWRCSTGPATARCGC